MIARVMHAWQSLHSLYARILACDLGLIAAGVAFFGFLSMFPALAAVIAVWGFAADPAVISLQLDLIRDFLPPRRLP